MSADDKVFGLAGDIADGRAVDWSAVQSSDNEHDRATLEELRAFAQLLADDGTLKYRSGPDDLPAGSTWGPLTIVAKVGNGRFGTVYRARDPRLDREVALKLLTWLPLDPLPSSSAIAEARLLARVRHPNVLTVHGAESIDGQIGIWSEFIEGRTLDQIVREHGTLSADEATAIGIDLCRALAAVHQAGLLHRDIKAQNVMRETGGRIVLMDFGTGHDPREVPARPGDLSGTPLYVAPEIFAGGSASVASDIYAVAVVLFLLLTGEYPVSGESLADVRDRHWDGVRRRITELTAAVPAPLAEVIERGLATDPAQRFSDSESFALALSNVQGIVDPDGAPRRPRGAQRSNLITAISVISAGALIAATGWFGTRSSRTGLGVDIQKLTSDGYARLPVISPDGSEIAYNRAWEPGFGVWVRDVGSGSERRIFVPDVNFVVAGLAFTPDGRELDVTGQATGTHQRPSLWRMSVSGGNMRQIATAVHSAVGWSPDGRRMAFIRQQPSGSFLIVADRDGSNDQVLATREQPQVFVNATMQQRPSSRPAWSPDGRTIAVATLDLSSAAHSAISLIDVRTHGEIREVSRLDQSDSQQPTILETAWVDENHLIFSGNVGDRRDDYQIWLLDVTRNVPQAVTHDPASYVGVSVTANRQIALTERASKQGSIWLGSSSGEHMSPVVPTSSAYPFLGSVSNGGDVVYSADTSDGPAIWLLRAGRNESTRVTLGDWPVFVPDGDRLIFVKHGKQTGLYSVNLDGTQLTQLVSGLATHPRVTPDGASVLFTASRNGPQSIWTLPVTGGTPRVLIRGAGNGAGLGWWVSANGRQLLALTNNATISCELPECATLKELQGEADPALHIHAVAQPEPYKQGLAFLDSHDAWFMPPGGTVAQRMTHFPELVAGSFSFSPNQHWLAVSRGIKSSDAVALKNFR